MGQYNAMTNVSKNTRKAGCLNNPACRWKGKEKVCKAKKSSLIEEEEEEEEEEEDETAEGGLVQRANCSQYNAMANVSKNTRKARCLNNPACRWKGKEKVCKAKKSSLIEEEEEEEEEEEDETAEGGLVQ